MFAFLAIVFEHWRCWFSSLFLTKLSYHRHQDIKRRASSQLLREIRKQSVYFVWICAKLHIKTFISVWNYSTTQLSIWCCVLNELFAAETSKWCRRLSVSKSKGKSLWVAQNVRRGSRKRRRCQDDHQIRVNRIDCSQTVDWYSETLFTFLEYWEDHFEWPFEPQKCKISIDAKTHW